MILPKNISPEFVCEVRKKRTQGYDTFKPCNNCVFYRWSFPMKKYLCKKSGSYMNRKGGVLDEESS